MSVDLGSSSELCAFVLARGREGMARVEIASALGVTVARLEARSREDAGLAEALALADEAAKAWWMALPRELLGSGRGQASAIWRAAVGLRFGEAEAAAPEPVRPRVVFQLPDNGRRWRPDGTAPCYDDDWDVRQCERELAEAEELVAEARQRLEEARAELAALEAEEAIPLPHEGSG